MHKLQVFAIMALVCPSARAGESVDDETSLLQVGKVVTHMEEKALSEKEVMATKQAVQAKLGSKEAQMPLPPQMYGQQMPMPHQMYGQQMPSPGMMPPMQAPPMGMQGMQPPPMGMMPQMQPPMGGMQAAQSPPMWQPPMGQPMMAPPAAQPVALDNAGAEQEEEGPVPWRRHRRRYQGYGAYGNPDYDYDRNRGYEDAGTGVYTPGGYAAPGWTPFGGYYGNRFGYGGYGNRYGYASPLAYGRGYPTWQHFRRNRAVKAAVWHRHHQAKEAAIWR